MKERPVGISIIAAAYILLAILSGLSGLWINGSFFSNVDFGYMLNLPLPKGVHVSTSVLFESSILLSVLGSVVYMLNTLGHPEGEESEWKS